MRVLDRYVARQLVPVWIWCLAVFVFLSCLIDLFEHLDEVLRYRIPVETIVQYYANLVPFILVRASPLALLLGGAFVATRLARHQEFLAINASGTSLLRASVPFVFVGWMISLLAFGLNEEVVPKTMLVYERLKQEAFRGRDPRRPLESVAIMDSFNRLYHARQVNLVVREARDLTILEHDRRNQPTKNVYAQRAIWTKHGWLLLYGTIYRVGPGGAVRGDPEPFVERLISYPITAESFARPEARPETMRYGQLRVLINRLRYSGISNTRRYSVELASKVTLPLMNLILCLLAFAGSTQPQLRGHLRGLGVSLGWGLVYYLGVGFFEGIGKRGVFGLPLLVAVWLPHLLAVGWCVRVLRRAP